MVRRREHFCFNTLLVINENKEAGLVYLKQSFFVDICEILQKSLLLPKHENSSVEETRVCPHG